MMKSKQMVKWKPIHPFPARMAPEIAVKALQKLEDGQVVVDPMAGSGTVLSHAALGGFTPYGFDLDPLAILITKVATKKANIKRIESLYLDLIRRAKSLKYSDIYLPWIDDDAETKEFIRYWFGKRQIVALRKIAFALSELKSEKNRCHEVDILRLALSRIIITKKVGASLAWDISHSRPHKKKGENDFDVFEGYNKSIRGLTKLLVGNTSIKVEGKIKRSDARFLSTLPKNFADAVITSPPYLNAIDYMRGHKFSLVWLGYSISSLRQIRSVTIGVERKIEQKYEVDKNINTIYLSAVKSKNMLNKHQGMVRKYIKDSIDLMAEISRILKPGSKATLVVGNSTLNGCYILNSTIYRDAGKLCGLKVLHSKTREIPVNKRYLPIGNGKKNALNKRMKEEVILTFVK